VTPVNPVPQITSLSPNSACEGSAGFMLTVNGTGFVNGSVVRLDGQPRTTTFVSATQLKAQIDAGDLIGQGQAQVTVFSPTPGGGVSNNSPFSITGCTNPAPVLTSISPNSAAAGAATFALTANGSSFAVSSKVRWDGTELQTAYGSANVLTAQVPANLVASQGTHQVTVFTPAPGGGTSAAQTFTIPPPGTNPVPTISALSPPAVGAGSAGFNLLVTGTNFVGASVVRLNGSNRATTVVSATQLKATILSGDIANTGD